MLSGMDVDKVLNAFLTEYPQEMAFGDEDPEVVLDRYFAPGFSFRNDGLLLDRDQLVAHARPARKNVTALEVEVKETIVEDARFAARYVLRAHMRKGVTLTNMVYAFGALDTSGKVVRVVQTVQTMPSAPRAGG